MDSWNLFEFLGHFAYLPNPFGSLLLLLPLHKQ